MGALVNQDVQTLCVSEVLMPSAHFSRHDPGQHLDMTAHQHIKLTEH